MRTRDERPTARPQHAEVTKRSLPVSSIHLMHAHAPHTPLARQPHAHALPIAAGCRGGPQAPRPARSPSVRRALPPVGVHRTAEQLPHITTVCEWEKTVVLRAGQQGAVARCERVSDVRGAQQGPELPPARRCFGTQRGKAHRGARAATAGRHVCEPAHVHKPGP